MAASAGCEEICASGGHAAAGAAVLLPEAPDIIGARVRRGAMGAAAAWHDISVDADDPAEAG